MSSLHQLFISKENVTYVISKSVELITKAKRVVNPKEKVFYETFNAVASKIFGYETTRLKHMNANEALRILNNIVIQEFSSYIIKKQPVALPTPRVQPQIKNLPEITPLQEELTPINNTPTNTNPNKIKETTFKLCLQDTKIHFSTPITNLTKIEFLSLHMYNKDYIITEFNNTLKLSNDDLIVLEPGNYTKDTFLDALQKQSSICISICDITGKIKFEGVEVNADGSTMQEIIGNIENEILFPVKLLKRNHINLGITMVSEQNYTYEETEEQSTHIEPIILKDTDKIEEYPLNVVKLFDKDYSINLKEISLDFDNYNHRGYPFYLMINITYIDF